MDGHRAGTKNYYLMRLTSRGWTVLAVLAITVAMSWEYGPRALNAVVTPLAVALVAGLVLTARAGRPTVRRHRVRDGFVGEDRTVELTLESDATIAATISDAVDDGLAATGGDPVAETTIDGETRIGYEFTFDRRGEHVLGPLSVTVTDVFGLVERRFVDDDQMAVCAYPRVYDLDDRAVADTLGLNHAAASPDREEFDHLREYQRGDALRDVNWKSAAKRPGGELVVTEYVTDEDAGAIDIAAECPSGQADELARAVASVAVALLDQDRQVGLTLGTGTLSPGAGRQHRHELLGLLAVCERCELTDEEREAADVVVTTDAGGTHVSVDGRELSVDQLVSDRARLRDVERGGERTGSGRRRAGEAQTGRDGDDNGDAKDGSPSGVAT